MFFFHLLYVHRAIAWMLTRYTYTIGRKAVEHILKGMYYTVRLPGP